ncbi:hypothetical protein BOX15_Mlig020535g1, partial [Macrostomum lignano]
ADYQALDGNDSGGDGGGSSARKRRGGLSRLAQRRGLLSPSTSNPDLDSPRERQELSESPQRPSPPLQSSPPPQRDSRRARQNGDTNGDASLSVAADFSVKSSPPPDLHRSHSTQELERLNEWDRGHSKRLGRLDRKLERRFDSSALSLGATASGDAASTSASVASSTGGGSSALRRIPVGDARRQPLLHGSVAAGGLLGADQLDQLVPDRRLELMSVTWNMGEATPQAFPEYLDPLFFPPDQEHVPDIYSLSVQEVCSDVEELLIRCQATIGPTHVLFEFCHYKSLLCAVFIRRDLVWFVSLPDTCAVQTRAAVYTKGCAAVCFTLFGSSMLFLSCHFKSDDGNFEARIEDYKKIVRKVDLPRFTKPMYQSDDVTERFDYVFWAGDLNFRLRVGESSRLRVDRLLQGENFSDRLTAVDELKMAQAEGRVFEHFLEGDIRFPPTYKFDIDTDNYDTSGKQRVPSYTDRVLYRCRKPGSATVTAYNSVPELRCSDHRAVYAVISLQIRPGSDNLPLAYGRFRHTFYVEGNKRRARRNDLDEIRRKSNRASSGVCSLM